MCNFHWAFQNRLTPSQIQFLCERLRHIDRKCLVIIFPSGFSFEHLMVLSSDPLSYLPPLFLHYLGQPLPSVASQQSVCFFLKQCSPVISTASLRLFFFLCLGFFFSKTSNVTPIFHSNSLLTLAYEDSLLVRSIGVNFFAFFLPLLPSGAHLPPCRYTLLSIILITYLIPQQITIFFQKENTT